MGGALTAELLGVHAAPHLAGPLAVMAAAGLGWWLRFRPSADTLAWRRGAAGERRTARLLVPLEHQSWAVLHDLAIPGSDRKMTTWVGQLGAIPLSAAEVGEVWSVRRLAAG